MCYSDVRSSLSPEAEAERDRLPRNERLAIATAVEKLETFGPNLPSPHQSKVMGAIDLRELRPRAGRSPWRPLYRRVAEDTFRHRRDRPGSASPGGGVFNKPHDVPRDDSRSWIHDEDEAESAPPQQGHS